MIFKKHEKPLFRHDCSECKFLGVFNKHDLYWCDSGKVMPTVIARYGDRREMYTSGMALASNVPELGEALRRAKDMGYIQVHADEEKEKVNLTTKDIFTYDVIKKYTGFGHAKYDMYGVFVRFDTTNPTHFDVGPWIELVPERYKIVAAMITDEVGNSMIGDCVDGKGMHSCFCVSVLNSLKQYYNKHPALFAELV